jgi:hypothetical protein
VVFLEVLRFGSLFDQSPDSYILGLDIETGKKVFENPTDGKFRFYPASLSVMNNGKAYLYGEFFDLNGNIAKDKSKGFGFWAIDEKGKVQSEKYCSWEMDMSKFLNVSSKGKIDDFGFMYLHNILQTSDGTIYAVGEGYKKVASALGIAAKVLTRNSGVSTLKIKVTDMILLKFDKDFNVKDAKIYDKNSNSIELQAGSEFMSTPLIGKMVKYYYDGFDYAYTQTNQDVSAFTVCYSDYVKDKDYKGGTFNSISYNEGKITTDHLNTKSNATRSKVLPGKLGQVLVLEYFKKEKKLDAHFEKLN